VSIWALFERRCPYGEYQLNVWIIIPPECPTNRHPDFLYKRPNNPSNDAVEPRAHSHLVSLFPSLSNHQMLSLFSVLLAPLLFFSGIAAAGPASAPRGYDDYGKDHGEISAPYCTDPTWDWVCTLSLPRIPRPLSDLLSDLQQPRPKSVLGRSVPVVDVQQGL
jgi:hypothetical protein